MNTNKKFTKFIKNPDSYQIDDSDEDYIDSGKYYKLEKKYLEFLFENEKGTCGISGYYSRGEFVIVEMASHPSTVGLGRETLKYMSTEFNKIDIPITVGDIIDAKKFWKKMSKEGYIN